ncbi:MAG: hypothetical protein ACJ750_07010 [Gaiellaceae bacterium]
MTAWSSQPEKRRICAAEYAASAGRDVVRNELERVEARLVVLAQADEARDYLAAEAGRRLGARRAGFEVEPACVVREVETTHESLVEPGERCVRPPARRAPAADGRSAP